MQKVAQSWLVLTHHRLLVGVLPRPRFVPRRAADPALHADRRRRRRSPRSAPAAAHVAVHPDGARRSRWPRSSTGTSSASGTCWRCRSITGLAQAFGGPAYQSLLPSLVDKKDLPNAIAFNSIQFNLARVIGPLLAGAALAAFGMVACFGLNGLSFLAVIAAILSLHIRHIPPTTTTRMHQELQERLRLRARAAGAHRPRRPRLRRDVPRQPAAHVPAALRAERLPRRRRRSTRS